MLEDYKEIINNSIYNNQELQLQIFPNNLKIFKEQTHLLLPYYFKIMGFQDI